MSQIAEVIIHQNLVEWFTKFVKEHHLTVDSALVESAVLVGGLTEEEASDALGVSVKKIKDIMNAARKKRDNLDTVLMKTGYSKDVINDYNRRRDNHELQLDLAAQRVAVLEEKERVIEKTLSYVKDKKLTVEEAADIVGLGADEYTDYVRSIYGTSL